MSEFNNRLREMRNKHGYTQLQVSEQIGVERSSYSLYESGRRNPDYSTLKAIAKIFGCTTDYLLGVTDEPDLVHYVFSDEELPDELKGHKVAVDIVKDMLDKGLSKEEIDMIIDMGLLWMGKNKKDL